ncbi:MAG: sulfite reductase (NADPH) flavoprotein alpha-component, partial [Glaciecola sp.]
MAFNNISALTSPLSELQLSHLQQATTDLTPVQTAWISGYLAGISQTPAATTVETVETAVSSGQHLSILFGSQTGNSKGAAEQLAEQAAAKGITHNLISMADYKVKNIKDESHLIVVVSTNGEGEAPDDAIDLHEFLATKKAPKLDNLKFAVLALGDSSYEFFCQTGKDFDQRLTALGATAIVDRLDADIDYEQRTPDWFEKVLNKVEQTLEKGGFVAPSKTTIESPLSVNKYDKKSPFTANLLTSQKITGARSAKDVHHIEIDLEGSDLHYKVGDALGVWFENDPQLVDALIRRLKLDPQEQVKIDDKNVSLKQALTESFELTATHPAFVEGYAKLTKSKKLLTLAEDKNKLRDFANTHQIIDVVSKKGSKAVTAEKFVALLRHLSPRLYSIAS